MYSSVIKSCLSLFSKCSSSTLAHTRDIQSYYRCKWRPLYAWKILKDLQLCPLDLRDPVIPGRTVTPFLWSGGGLDHLSIFCNVFRDDLFDDFVSMLFVLFHRACPPYSIDRPPFPVREFEYVITLFDPRRWFSKVLISQDWSPSVHSAFPTK